MKQRKVMRWVLGCLLAAGCAADRTPGTWAAQAEAPLLSQKHLNVVMIISDDQAWGDYGFMGHLHIQTPRLDRLAAESLTYTRGYVPDSLCRPSLATMITGLYPHEHGIVGNDPALPEGAGKRGARTDPKTAPLYEALIRNIETHDTLPRLLGEHGYLSLQTGKWWEGAPARGGFTHAMTHGDPKRGGRHGDVGLKIGREGMAPIADFLDTAQKQDKPFFIWYAPFLPHTPHNPPKRLLEKYLQVAPTPSIAKYWAMCEWFDETCGQLLDMLERRGLSDDTLIVYACDNGWINRPDASRYAPRSKRSPYDGGLRTPIMVRWPGKVGPAMDKTTLASTVDLAPTILKACGVKVPAAMTGLDLRDTAALKRRNRVQGAVYAHDVADVKRPAASLKWRWIIDGDDKLIVPNPRTQGEAKAELFDVTADPHERENVAASEPETVARLKRALDAWLEPADRTPEAAP